MTRICGKIFFSSAIVFSVWTGRVQAQSFCNGDCAGSPLSPRNAHQMSSLSQHLLDEQIDQVVKELILNPPASKGAETVTVPVQIATTPFNPEKHSPKKTKTKTLPFDEAPESALFLMFQMPSQLSTATEGRDRLSVNASASNSMLHGTELHRKDGAVRKQELDGLGTVNQLTLERGNKNFSITMSLREFQLIGSPQSIWAYPVSDQNIERFHSAIGYEDPYHRKKKGMNKTKADIQDADGRSLAIKEGRSYVLPLLVQLKHFDKIGALSTANSKAETTLVTGVQAAVPLGPTFSQGGIGTTATLVHNHQLRENLVATVAAGMAVNLQRTFGNRYQPFDRPTKLSWGSDASVGLTCLGRKGSATTTTLFMSVDPTPLDAKNYETPNGAYLQNKSQGAVMEQDYAVGLAVTHQTEKGLAVSGSCKEDFGGVYRGKGSIGGNNNRDFSCGFSVSKNF